MDMTNNQRFVFSVLLICFSLKWDVSGGVDSISVNQPLSGDQTIVSAGGFFELGFFKPGNSSNYYLGMWYKKVSEQTVVWVANRDKPISDRFSSLLRFSYGNLVLYDESQIPTWSTNLNTTNISSSIEAVLLDEGNLVLRDLSNDFLWQSFDNPTHAWLPGMKIGFNKRTKEKKRLTSWKNIEDPAPGLFSLELDPDGTDQYVMVWNESEIFWHSGIWSGKMYSSVPEMAYFINNDMYNASFISNENEQSFIYFVKDPNFISRFILDASGQVRQMYWLENTSKSWFQIWSTPRQPCEIYAYCGAFGSCSEQTQSFCGCVPGFKPNSEHNWNLLHDHSGGCVRETQLQCENNSLANGESDRFLANHDITLPEHPQSVAVRNITGCKTICLNDCSCTAYAYEDSACSIWNWNLMNLQQLAKVNLIAEGGDILSLLDKRLESNADVEEISRMLKVACWCIQDDENHRPSMAQVVQMLEGIVDVTQPPVPRCALFQNLAPQISVASCNFATT
ncbi:hypothetical protein EZV62_020540 [Acer yangbiense]|uniref:Bulb-type lectin domain-containing protein n=1 Tax=Acer yangbiense TaxID=1000413 RepID=A0A5C7HE47_9ROSI|nr:hypothetical protein EZV62_020540 [Acer yangbiense]